MMNELELMMAQKTMHLRRPILQKKSWFEENIRGPLPTSSNHMSSKEWNQIITHLQTSTVAPMKFGNG